MPEETRQLSDHQISRDEWDALTDEEKFEYVRLGERSAYDLYRLLDLVPCPDHGACIPYFTTWVKAHLPKDGAVKSTRPPTPPRQLPFQENTGGMALGSWFWVFVGVMATIALLLIGVSNIQFS